VLKIDIPKKNNPRHSYSMDLHFNQEFVVVGFATIQPKAARPKFN